MPEKLYLTAEEAIAELGVSRATLYAYVSRGLIRSEPDDVRRRTRRYAAEDVMRLKMRQEHRADPAKAVRDSLNWGVPIIDSAITKIADGLLYYRGYDAVALADTHTVEDVAALIWTGSFDGAANLFQGPAAMLPELFWTTRDGLGGLPDYDKAATLLPIAAHFDAAAFDLRPIGVARSGRRILAALAAAITGRQAGATGLAKCLAESWCSIVSPMGTLPTSRAESVRSQAIGQAERIIGSSLILCADHELSVSSFVARSVASAGASPYAVVEGGLATLRGYKHGGMIHRVEAFLAECDSFAEGVSASERLPLDGGGRSVQRGIAALIAGRLQRGEGIPGFGHQLYPDGDPRVKKLLLMLHDAYPGSPRLALYSDVIEQVWHALSDHPNIDFGLVMLSRILDLPSGSALCLLAQGRSIGWIGHAIEEYRTGRLIRPRARYVGE